MCYCLYQCLICSYIKDNNWSSDYHEKLNLEKLKESNLYLYNKCQQNLLKISEYNSRNHDKITPSLCRKCYFKCRNYII